VLIPLDSTARIVLHDKVGPSVVDYSYETEYEEHEGLT